MTETGQGRGYSNQELDTTQLQEPDQASPTISYGEPDQVKQNTSLCKQILRWRKYLILVLTPILLMPIPIAIPGTVGTFSLSVSRSKARLSESIIIRFK